MNWKTSVLDEPTTAGKFNDCSGKTVYRSEDIDIIHKRSPDIIMKVYVLIQYEGDTTKIMGVYKDENKAQSLANDYNEKSNSSLFQQEVQEFELLL